MIKKLKLSSRFKLIRSYTRNSRYRDFGLWQCWLRAFSSKIGPNIDWFNHVKTHLNSPFLHLFLLINPPSASYFSQFYKIADKVLGVIPNSLTISPSFLYHSSFSVVCQHFKLTLNWRHDVRPQNNFKSWQT